jgi:hypothetical protein
MDGCFLGVDWETWRFVNSFADWAAALATFAAVLVALYLARREDRIKLEVEAGVRVEGRLGDQVVVLGPGAHVDGEGAPRLVWVHVTNVHRRSATVTHLFVRPALSPSKRGVLLPHLPQGHYSSGVPVTLADGESADYGWPLAEFLAGRDVAREYKGVLGAVKLMLVRVWVGTSTGHEFSCRPEKELRELLWTRARGGRRAG